MFGYFNKNKFRYNEKGQLIPIFIVIIVVLIVMAMLTVNLAKVGLIKTESSNAADAGALAGGSVMASVFNGQAIANSQLMVNYQMFFAEMGALAATIVIAAFIGAIICSAMGCEAKITCCPSSGCIVGFTIAQAGIIAAMVSVIAFHIAQAFTYMSMGKQANQGREQALEMAYRYAFINSGIGTKLISGSPPTDAADKRGDDNNYSETFNDFVKSSAVTSGNYVWKDGQDRHHQVNVRVSTQKVDNYKLKYGALPTIVLVLILYNLSTWAKAALVNCNGCPCTAWFTFLVAKGLALGMASVIAGLLPAWEADESVAMMIVFPLCWVVNINHDRRLTVTTQQEHAGYNYGLWQTTYPHVESKSVVSFQGNGKIYQPNPRFDADIVETD